MTALLVGTAMIGLVVLGKQLITSKTTDVNVKPEHQRVIKKTN